MRLVKFKLLKFKHESVSGYSMGNFKKQTGKMHYGGKRKEMECEEKRTREQKK